MLGEARRVAPRGSLLLVEDDPGACKLFAGLLRRAGFVVSRSETCEEALDALKARPPLR